MAANNTPPHPNPSPPKRGREAYLDALLILGVFTAWTLWDMIAYWLKYSVACQRPSALPAERTYSFGRWSAR